MLMKRNRKGGAVMSQKITRILRWSILTAAILLIVLGIFGGGVSAIIANAIAICTGCIGLG